MFAPALNAASLGAGQAQEAINPKELDVHSIDDLAAAVDAHELRALDGFGAADRAEARTVDRPRVAGEDEPSE